jgi:hypothetical protein
MTNMEPPKNRPWHKKWRYRLPLAAIGGIALLSSFGDSSKPVIESTVVPVPIVQQLKAEPPQEILKQETSTTSEVSKPVESKKSTQTPTGLSNDNYYVNTAGNTVHSPAYSSSVPAGASARCRDGTYSFSQSRSGTCSHHGGVGEWL